MPVYDYKCKECKNRFSVEHSMDSKTEIKCPECGGEVSQIMNIGGIAFKGSGFYVNDKGGACPHADPHSEKCSCCHHNH